MGALVAKLEDEYHADAVNIDQGYGTGLYSWGISHGRNWNLIPFGARAPKEGFLNYMADQVRKWLRDGGCLPDDQTISDDLTMAYQIAPSDSGVLKLRSKKELEDEGIPSPNDGDALMLTFAIPVVRPTEKRTMANTEYHF